jgi:hypothetical protein
MKVRIILQATIDIAQDRRYLGRAARRWLEEHGISADYATLTLRNGDSYNVAMLDREVEGDIQWQD